MKQFIIYMWIFSAVNSKIIVLNRGDYWMKREKICVLEGTYQIQNGTAFHPHGAR